MNDIEALREKAKAATPGPWGFQYTDEAGECFIIAKNFGGMVGAALPWPTEIDARDFRRVVANADFIAAASPDVILSLLSERDRLREAARAVLKSWDERGQEQERLVTSSVTGNAYWSPAASMVSSEAMSELRAALTPEGN